MAISGVIVKEAGKTGKKKEKKEQKKKLFMVKSQSFFKHCMKLHMKEPRDYFLGLPGA